MLKVQNLLNMFCCCWNVRWVGIKKLEIRSSNILYIIGSSRMVKKFQDKIILTLLDFNITIDNFNYWCKKYVSFVFYQKLNFYYKKTVPSKYCLSIATIFAYLPKPIFIWYVLHKYAIFYPSKQVVIGRNVWSITSIMLNRKSQ